MLLFAAVTATGYGFTPSAGGLLFAAVLLVILFGTVFAAVHHAEVIAHRIGEPYGTLLLTLAVTIIEVALIATMMLGDSAVPALARDTVFAVVMIVCNGLVGVCIFIGGLRYREQDVQVSGANAYLSVLFAMATITLVLPNYTLTTPGPVYSAAQLGFVSVVTILLYGGVPLHPDHPASRLFRARSAGPGRGQRARSRAAMLALSVALLLVSLLAVVLLAKKFSLVVDAGDRRDRRAAGVCRRRGGAADPAAGERGRGRRRAQERPAEEHQPGARLVARHHRPDHSGGRRGRLCAGQAAGAGADRAEMVLLVLTFILSMLTFGTGRTNILFGLVHMVVFAVFVFMVFVP